MAASLTEAVLPHLGVRHLIAMNWKIVFVISLAGVTSLGCADGPAPVEPAGASPATDSQRNILFIIADDLGKDAVTGFSEGSVKPNTPHLDGLTATGLTFSNLWVTPSCAPTRAAAITGRYGFRTGVTKSGKALPSSETVVQAYIEQEVGDAYTTAVVGKWHLSRSLSFNPESLGIDYYAGILEAEVDDYFQWPLTEDGVTTTETGYATEVLTDLAIEWVGRQERPWFLWLAYNAPHAPFHAPPAEMHSQGALPEFRTGMDPTAHYMAAVEALDYQLGRLLVSLTPAERAQTTIIFVGDNGSPRAVAQAPYGATTSKGSLYQGGINTPLVVSGRQVTRTGTDDSIINSTDLFATIAELAGVEVSEIGDSKSFLSLLSSGGTHREFAYSAIEEDGGISWTVRDRRHKLIVRAGGEEEMFDLLADPYEQVDLHDAGLDDSQLQTKATMNAWLVSIGG